MHMRKGDLICKAFALLAGLLPAMQCSGQGIIEQARQRSHRLSPGPHATTSSSERFWTMKKRLLRSMAWLQHPPGV